MDNKDILINQGTDYKEMTKELLKASDLIGRIPDRSCKIGIKPNLVSPSEASYGATTHPEVIAGIIEYLQGYGIRDITIMEGSWVGAKTMEAVRVCGYEGLIQSYQVDFVDAQKSPWEKKDCRGMELAVCSCADQVDLMINVPVLKGHCQTKITCALKNMKGLIPNKEKRRFHQMGLHRPIIWRRGSGRILLWWTISAGILILRTGATRSYATRSGRRRILSWWMPGYAI